MTDPETGRPPTPATGDDAVDAAVRSLPVVPDTREGTGLDLQEHLDQVTEVHRQLQQRLSDLSP